MFTVKHVERGGKETVFQATDIRKSSEGTLAFGQEKVVSTGKVYVMNEQGHTVAVYDFDKQQKEQKNEQ